MQDQKKRTRESPGFLGTSLVVLNTKLEANTTFEVNTPES